MFLRSRSVGVVDVGGVFAAKTIPLYSFEIDERQSCGSFWVKRHLLGIHLDFLPQITVSLRWRTLHTIVSFTMERCLVGYRGKTVCDPILTYINCRFIWKAFGQDRMTDVVGWRHQATTFFSKYFLLPASFSYF